MAFRPVVTPFGTLAGERLKRAKELYKVYDADDSGGIDLKEFAAVAATSTLRCSLTAYRTLPGRVLVHMATTLCFASTAH